MRSSTFADFRLKPGLLPCRMCWSFSRDHGLPLSGIWAQINPYVGVPVNAVWFMVTFAFLLGLPMLKSAVAFSAVVRTACRVSAPCLICSYSSPYTYQTKASSRCKVAGSPLHSSLSYSSDWLCTALPKVVLISNHSVTNPSIARTIYRSRFAAPTCSEIHACWQQHARWHGHARQQKHTC